MFQRILRFEQKCQDFIPEYFLVYFFNFGVKLFDHISTKNTLKIIKLWFVLTYFFAKWQYFCEQLILHLYLFQWNSFFSIQLNRVLKFWTFLSWIDMVEKFNSLMNNRKCAVELNRSRCLTWFLTFIFRPDTMCIVYLLNWWFSILHFYLW